MRSVLVANRGEIARRVFATARRRGLATVAVYSDPDAAAPHVRDADAAVRLPGAAPAQTYLRGELIIAAALRTGADAIHPGYGFLSENAGFARAVQQAGLTWIGPSPEAIEAMGSKIEAKRLMAAAGVPVLEQLDPGRITAARLPVLVKASAGGGGRGMRIVRTLDELPGAIEAASAEAASAFGDAAVFCERYLPEGHHVEVQVICDTHGTVWALGERECSIQRRHQKVLEEAPSPLVERIPGMREALFRAATTAASSISYLGAGTVEFLAAESGEFFFLEMNTRLQVEHPVTECTTGVDLVALQFDVAEGGALPLQPPVPGGHSFEARLYAEDPAADWQPQSGPVHLLDVPGVTARFAAPAGVPSGVRLDATVGSGSLVGIHYDPMLAKVISWAPTRTGAAALLADSLARTRLHGLRTNRDLLVNLLRHPALLAGDTTTAFFARHDVTAPLADERTGSVSALAAALALDAAAAGAAAAVRLPRVPSGWRNVPSAPQFRDLVGADGREHHVAYRLTRAGLDAPDHPGAGLIKRTQLQPGRQEAAADQPGGHWAWEIVLELDGVRRAFEVSCYGTEVFVDSALGPVGFTVPPRFPDPADQVAPGSLVAPMPGAIVRVAVAAGDRVRQGQPVLWLEAMKMQHRIDAPADGIVTELPVTAGQQVDVGTVLAVVTADDKTED